MPTQKKGWISLCQPVLNRTRLLTPSLLEIGHFSFVYPTPQGFFSDHLQLRFPSTICIGNSTVSRGIWDKYREWYFKIHQNITRRRGGEWYLGSFEISRAGINPKYPEETVLFPVYTTRQRNFALYVTGVIFTCKYFKFGINTTGLSQSHFRNLSAGSIKCKIL